MAKQIAKADREAMNSLFASEFDRLAAKAGLKQAASAKELADDNGKEQGPQAFKDHEDYVGVVSAVLNDDKTEAFDPNDIQLD